MAGRATRHGASSLFQCSVDRKLPASASHVGLFKACPLIRAESGPGDEITSTSRFRNTHWSGSQEFCFDGSRFSSFSRSTRASDGNPK